MSGPKLLNLIEIETRWGYRSFELYQGNILAFQQPIDLLAVSALAHDLKVLADDPSQYSSVGHTLIGALKTQAGVDVASYGKDCEFDLRAALGCWVSRPTSSPVFKRIVCVEDIGLHRPVEEAVENLFVSLAVLEAKSVGAGTLLLPLLGAGGMGLDPERIMHSLLTSAQSHFPRLPKLERIFFVELDSRKAEALNQAMNKVLGRVKVTIPKGELIRGVRRDILERIEAAAALTAEGGSRPLADLRRVIGSEESRSFEIGIAGRRLAEFVVQDFAGIKKGRPLVNGIEDLAAHGVADWIRSYLHTLRVFGNESAHEKGHEKRHPPALSEADIALCFFCILRVLDFWIETRRGRG